MKNYVFFVFAFTCFSLCWCVDSVDVPESCTTQTNTDYSSAGNLVTLYNVGSASQCCSACEGFEECKYFSWRASNNQCFPKSSASTKTTANDVVGGTSTNTYTRNTVCSSENGYEYVFSSGTLSHISANSTTDCCNACKQYVGCNYWKLNGKDCYLQASMGLRKANTGYVSGTVLPTPHVTQRTGKRGLGVYGTNSCSDIKLLKQVSWVYNWGGQPGGILEGCYNDLGIEFVPMLWGLKSNIDDLYTKAKHLLVFNEPNFKDQSNMSPQDAAAAWPAIQKFAQQYGMKVSSPSASYGGQTDPIKWLDDFFTACKGCQVDFITTHQYDCRPYDLYGAMGNFKKYNKPIWVTEFGCFSSNTSTDLVSYAKTLLPLFDNDAAFERYAWFGSRSDANYVVFDPSKNALTPLGVTYAA